MNQKQKSEVLPNQPFINELIRLIAKGVTKQIRQKQNRSHRAESKTVLFDPPHNGGCLDSQRITNPKQHVEGG